MMNQIMDNLSSHRALKVVYEELDDDTNMLIHFHDPYEDEVPSEQLSIWVFVGIFFSFLACSGVFVYLILVCSRAQEKAKAKAEEKKVSKRDEAFKGKLECRPWSEWGDKTADLTESMSQTENTDSSASDGSDDEESTALEKPPQSLGCDIECGNKSKTHCRICDNAFENGQSIYQSNNPKCNHQFHQVCADKWLQYQNSCPTCNEPYVLDVV